MVVRGPVRRRAAGLFRTHTPNALCRAIPESMIRFAAILLLVLSQAAPAQEAGTPPSIAIKTASMQKLPGYFPLFWDATAGKLWLQIDRLDEEFLYLESLASGIGSNDIGLDRGQMGGPRVVRFERIGPKVLLIQPNYSYRAISDDAAEQDAVAESFAKSVLWGFEVGAVDGDRVLVDATSFVVRDAHNIVRRLKQRKQGAYKLDVARSAVSLPRTKGFPENTEMEATLTFTGQAEDEWIRSVTPTAAAVTVRQHHSFVKLPPPGYQPRPFDPRAGFNSISYRDYAAPLGQPVEQRFIARHRLEKKDPTAAVSEAVEPIVYYLDPGVPEPVRSALLEGAGWWNEAFEAAGFRNGFQVKMLPADADPMDVRYNLIQWVHRSTRGWSYGASMTDPRTGEIIKGKVSLGSLRVRQDYLIAEALLAPYASGQAAPAAMREMALARLRQLSAHEVGHTLGLSHNYIASAQGRTSVMDYPHPLVKLTAAGEVDLSDAYDTGIGEWDKVSISYGYRQFAPATDAPAELEAILAGARARGLTFLSDQDARPAGSAHPAVHLWDNGADAAAELNHMMKVRAKALERFSEQNIQEGRPLATLEEALVPLYLSHRYQTEAAAKAVGGLVYTYALRGDGQTPASLVPADQQWSAVNALLETLSPAALTLPDRILDLIPPRPLGYNRHRETFPSRTGLAFDPLAAAETAAGHTVSLLLQRERCARLVQYAARDASQPAFDKLLDRIIQQTWKAPRESGLAAEVQRTVDHVVLRQLLVLAADARTLPQVRALVRLKVADLGRWTAASTGSNAAQHAHLKAAAALIAQFETDPEKFTPAPLLPPPPGQPI
jgi:uncharacterized protein DUF4953/uncharacterized protein DUF5117